MSKPKVLGGKVDQSETPQDVLSIKFFFKEFFSQLILATVGTFKRPDVVFSLLTLSKYL